MRRRAGPVCQGGRVSSTSRSWSLLILTGMLVAAAAVGGQAQLIDVSGRFGLDTVMVPIPATLIDEIKLDTPAELTLLKFGIEASLGFTAAWNNVELRWDSAINIAGPERLILEGTLPMGPILLEPELWLAVPFETVTDVDHFVNWVVIPPGDLMFVKTRCTAEASYGGINFRILMLLEDVNFPDPGTDFGPLWYGVQSQSFRYGSIVTATAEILPGITLTSVTNINADGGSNAVKGHSASGRAYRSCTNDSWFNETLTLTGLEYCDVPYWLRMTIDPLAAPFIDLAGGGSLTIGMLGFDLGGSISFFPIDISGFSFSGTVCDSFSMSVSLSEKLAFEGASFSCSSSIDLGQMMLRVSGSGSISASGGIPGLNVSASVTQGAFSGGLAVGISDQQGQYRLSSFTTHFSVSNAPIAYSVSVSFGRTGLKRAVLSIGVVF